MLDHIWVIPLVTFVSFWLIIAVGKRLPRGGSEIGVAALGLALVLSTVAAVQWVDQEKVPSHEPAATADAGHGAEAEAGHGAEAESEAGHGAEAEAGAEAGHGAEAEAHPAIRESVEHNYQWWSSSSFTVMVGTHVDGVTVALLFVVSLISFLVHIFSTNYMEGDKRFTHYFAFLSLFTTGMYVLVVSSTTLQMLFGWELMGLCSFALIGHWWEEKANTDAALKAFLTTRTGDVGLLVGITILFWIAGTFNIAEINEKALAGDLPQTALLVAAIALFAAVIGKSAQFPLHTWLPDAMAGPTPVSALIHAATMVVAGVYLVIRLYGVFWEAFDIGAGGVNLIAATGGFTILMAAALAFVQRDIKKVLAYSTISQLGYMVMALGVGAWTAALFHLFTHAFFKALLFLGSGSVSHAVHSFDMKKDMGGLRSHMPVTFWTFIIGSLALAGFFPFAGFWSKDEILLGAGSNGYEFFLVVGLVGAFMTTMYMTRCVYLTFFGEYRGHGHPHESPAPITVPLVVLSVFSVLVGLINSPWLFGGEWFGHTVENEVFELAGVPVHEFSPAYALVSTAVVVVAFAIGYVLWFRQKLPSGVTERSSIARAGYALLANKYYLDVLYTDIIVGNLKRGVAAGAYWFNRVVLDGIVNGVGTTARVVGDGVYRFVDRGLIDGAVNGSGITADASGGALRRLQTGRVQQYGIMLFLSAALLALGLVIFTS